MNRELEKILKEKWFLVAADLIAVGAILIVMPEKRDGLDNFLVLCAILAAALIVVIPVLQDGGSKTERQADQARLRAKLAEEIDLQRDNVRAGNEALNRRIGEVELTAQKVAEQAVAAVAQRASAEINTLKATLAALEKKLQELASTASAQEAIEEVTAKLDALAETVRTVVADADEAVQGKAEAAQALESELDSVRAEMKKAAKQSNQAVAKAIESLEALQAEVRILRVQAPVVSPASASASLEPTVEAPEVPEAPAILEVPAEDPSDSEAEAEEASMEEFALEDAPMGGAPAGDAGAGTALIINLMIGIGNKPFVRGIGPGLSQDKGVPMNFLGIGRWQWLSPDPEAPATIEVWKNDQSPMGEPLHLSGGEPLEVDEGHFGGG